MYSAYAAWTTVGERPLRWRAVSSVNVITVGRLTNDVTGWAVTSRDDLAVGGVVDELVLGWVGVVVRQVNRSAWTTGTGFHPSARM
jgi:hypothetical protein